MDLRGSSLIAGDSAGVVTRLSARADDRTLAFDLPETGSTFDCGSAVYCLQGSSDNAHHFVAGCADGSVQIWTTRSGKRLSTATTHSGWVFGLQFDTHKLLSASYDGAVHVYDFPQQQVTAELQHVSGATYGHVLFSVQAWG
jgi:WD40 repeat protein